jgi:hypothetical protein
LDDGDRDLLEWPVVLVCEHGECPELNVVGGVFYFASARLVVDDNGPNAPPTDTIWLPGPSRLEVVVVVPKPVFHECLRIFGQQAVLELDLLTTTLVGDHLLILGERDFVPGKVTVNPVSNLGVGP